MTEILLVGDVRKKLVTIGHRTARTCITSPPYFGLRDYGTADWKGGSELCDHQTPPTGGPSAKGQRGKFSADGQYRDVCLKCGAQRIDDQIGIEASVEDYVSNLVDVFRCVRDVLTDDGTLWLNLGDSYNGSGGNHKENHKNDTGFQGAAGPNYGGRGNKIVDLKPKDLIGIPWRVAFALQQDGWYLRSEIIWAKPNPMPESVTDRPTKSHEHIFLLTKSQRYYYDHEAIKEPAVSAGQSRGGGKKHSGEGSYIGRKEGQRLDQYGECPDTRNRRDVWTIATKPFKGAHFAVMPEALVEPCILAGSASGDTVLDPFTGSGTVGVVAKRYKRSFIGTELNPEYAKIARNRIDAEHESLF